MQHCLKWSTQYCLDLSTHCLALLFCIPKAPTRARWAGVQVAEGGTNPGSGPAHLASLLSHHNLTHTHKELFAAPQTCHVLLCFLPLRKLLPLPGVSFFTLLQSPFCLGNYCPSFKIQLSPPPQSLLMLLVKELFLSDPKCSPKRAGLIICCMITDSLSISPHHSRLLDKKAQDPVHTLSSWAVLNNSTCMHAHAHMGRAHEQNFSPSNLKRGTLITGKGSS